MGKGSRARRRHAITEPQFNNFRYFVAQGSRQTIPELVGCAQWAMCDAKIIIVKETRTPKRLAMETFHLSGVERAKLPQILCGLTSQSFPVGLGDWRSDLLQRYPQAPARRSGNISRPRSTPARFGTGMVVFSLMKWMLMTSWLGGSFPRSFRSNFEPRHQ